MAPKKDTRESRLAEIFELEEKIQSLYTKRIKLEELIGDFRNKAGKDLESYNKALDDSNNLRLAGEKVEQAIAQLRGLGYPANRDEILFLKARQKLLTKQSEMMEYELSLIDRRELVQKEANKQLEAHLKTLGNSISAYVGGLSEWLSFYNDIDKSFRKTVFQMGKTQDGSKILRDNLSQVASYAADLGSNFQEVAEMQANIVDLTGRQVILTQANLKAITLIAKGTTLGVQGASELVSQFDRLGLSASMVKEFTEGTLNDAANIGVNGNQSIQLINKNLEKAQRYGFKNGIDGLKNMVIYSQKFQLNMDAVFNAIDKTSSLEGAVDSVSRLTVLGGKFAQSDPFRLLYLARNDAEGFSKEISNMTEGLIKFDKEGKALPLMGGDLQRAKAAAEALNMSVDDLIKTAQAGGKVKRIEALLPSLSKEDREFLSSVADMKDGKYVVQFDSKTVRDIQSLSASEVKKLRDSKIDLEKQAKESQAVDELFKNAIISLKSSLLPILEGLNTLITGLSKTGIPKVLAAVSVIGVAALGMGKAASLIGFATKGLGGLLSGGLGKLIPAIGGGGGAMGGGASAAGGALGGGGGFMATLKGSASGLASLLPVIGEALVVVGALELAIWGMGYALQSWIPVLPVLADAIKTIVGGVFDSLGDLIVKISGPEVGIGLIKTAAGVFALGTALTAFGVGAGIASLVGAVTGQSLLDSIKEMSSMGEGLSKTSLGLDSISKSYKSIGESINSINLDNLKELKETSESLSKVSIAQGLFDTLSKVFDKPMKMEFDDSNKINIYTDITLKMDSDVLVPKIAYKIQKSLTANKKGTHPKSI